MSTARIFRELPAHPRQKREAVRSRARGGIEKSLATEVMGEGSPDNGSCREQRVGTRRHDTLAAAEREQ